VTEEVTTPRNDGSFGSALYTVPLQLNREPDALENGLLRRNWNRPPLWTLKHRPGILRVVGDQLVLDGTTIEEVEHYHAKTLSLVIDQTNQEALEYRSQAERQAKRKASVRLEHKANVAEVVKRIKF